MNNIGHIGVRTGLKRGSDFEGTSKRGLALKTRVAAGLIGLLSPSNHNQAIVVRTRVLAGAASGGADLDALTVNHNEAVVFRTHVL